MNGHPGVPRKPLIVTTLAGLTVGALGGWWAGSRHAPAENSSRAALSPARQQASPSPVAPPGVGKPAAAPDAAVESPATDAPAATAQIARALRSTNPVKRSLQFHAVLALMTPENGQFYLDGWLEYLRENPPPLSEAPLFNRRIGEVLGAVVVGSRTGDSPRDGRGARTFVRDQFLGWMDTDPTAARAWLDGLENEEFRETMVGSYFDAMSEENPAGAVALLRTMPEDLQVRYARQMVSTMREAKSPEEVGNWISGLAAGGDENRNAPWLHAACDGLMESLLNQTRGAGELAARIFEQHSGQPYADHSWGLTIAGRYAASDPANGLAWALRMAARPEFSSNADILRAAGDGIPAGQLLAAADLCDPADGPARDLLLARIAERLQESDPAAAAATAARIKDPTLRPVPPPDSAP
jgi:hypothetical protein